MERKRTNDNVLALEERSTILSNDSEVRKFDAKRIMCNICDRWLNVDPKNHSEAIRDWYSHRAVCQKSFRTAGRSGDQVPTQFVNLF